MRIAIDSEFQKDLNFWRENNKKIFEKIHVLTKAILKSPYNGIGKPEPLKHQLAGCWSRRINGEHRLVYRIVEDELQLLSCRYHYQK